MAYTHRQYVWAVNLSALLGWACIVSPLAINLVWGMLVWAAIIGLPIAFLCCWVIGAPVLHYIMRDSVTWFAAIAWGAAIGGLISLVVLVILLIAGITMWVDPTYHTKIGGHEFVRLVDEMLTAEFWMQLLQTNLLLLGLAVFIALVLRAVIGPGTLSSLNFKQLNDGWNAHPVDPDPRIEVRNSVVKLSFSLNPFFYEAKEGEQACLTFRDCSMYRLGEPNDHGWYLGQCRYGKAARDWGEFYELSGEDKLRLKPTDWNEISPLTPDQRHFLFYLRDNTFECFAVDWTFEREILPG